MFTEAPAETAEVSEEIRRFGNSVSAASSVPFEETEGAIQIEQTVEAGVEKEGSTTSVASGAAALPLQADLMRKPTIRDVFLAVQN